MIDEWDSVEQKVTDLFTELAGERTARLKEPAATQTRELLATALQETYSPEISREIAFHLVDWNTDAAFMMAVHLFPERFTQEELRDGVGMLLVHAPNHLAAAAELAGYPVEDIFEVGVRPIGNERPESKESSRN